jgi:hypothetical protein
VLFPILITNIWRQDDDALVAAFIFGRDYYMSDKNSHW